MNTYLLGKSRVQIKLNRIAERWRNLNAIQLLNLSLPDITIVPVHKRRYLRYVQ